MKKSVIAIIVIALASIQYCHVNTWKGKLWREIIEGNFDGYGYYAYLPAVFIHHSFNFTNVMADERKWERGISEQEVFEPFPAYNGKLQDKYYVGVAILLAPFFLLAYFLSYLIGYDTGGYSFFFQLSVSAAAIFYFIVGLIYIRKLLLLYKVPELVIGLLLILVSLGTNAFYYATIGQSASHIYSFCLCAMFLYFTKRSIQQFQTKHLVIMAATMGLMILVRPTNALLLFAIPFLTTDGAELKSFLQKIFTRSRLVILFTCCFGIVALQFLVYYFETGRFFIWSYQKEGFDFLHPQIINVLISYRKGWLLYTPLMLIIIVTAVVMFTRHSVYHLFSFILFLGVILYILSCWWAWFYGGSFGQRPFVDYYPFFVLVFALALQAIRSRFIRASILTISFLTLVVNLIQLHEYQLGLLLYDNMDEKRYWSIFLRSDSPYLGFVNTDAYTEPYHIITCSMENLTSDNYAFLPDRGDYHFQGGQFLSHTETHSGKNSLKLDKDNQYGGQTELSVKPGDMIKTTAWRKSSSDKAVMVLSAKEPKEFYAAGEKIIDSLDNGWEKIECTAIVPDGYKHDTIFFYFYNPSDTDVYFDDLSICLYHRR